MNKKIFFLLFLSIFIFTACKQVANEIIEANEVFNNTQQKKESDKNSELSTECTVDNDCSFGYACYYSAPAFMGPEGVERLATEGDRKCHKKCSTTSQCNENETCIEKEMFEGDVVERKKLCLPNDLTTAQQTPKKQVQAENPTPAPKVNKLSSEPQENAQPKKVVEPQNTITQPAFSGIKLAGNSSPLFAFNNNDYQSALNSNKNIVLFFHANWCSSCAREFPKMQAAFNELQRNDVVGFQVNYRDNETDEFEKKLARDLGVPYQTTKVFLKNKNKVLHSTAPWEKKNYLDAINENF